MRNETVLWVNGLRSVRWMMVYSDAPLCTWSLFFLLVAYVRRMNFAADKTIKLYRTVAKGCGINVVYRRNRQFHSLSYTWEGIWGNGDGVSSYMVRLSRDRYSGETRSILRRKVNVIIIFYVFFCLFFFLHYKVFTYTHNYRSVQ